MNRTGKAGSVCLIESGACLKRPAPTFGRAPRRRLIEVRYLLHTRGARASPHLSRALRQAPESLFKSLIIKQSNLYITSTEASNVKQVLSCGL